MIPVTAPPTPEGSWPQRLARAVRDPKGWLDTITGTGPSGALLVLFALNAVDELGRQSFFILAPNMADDFGTGMAGIIVPFALAYAAALGFSVYVATLADRYNRVRLALIGGLVFTFFSGGIGLSAGVWMLGFMAAGANIGKAVIEPAHNSLLADYYPVDVRPRVYSFHRAGNAVGAFAGGILIGSLASVWGWRAPFFIFMVPTLLLVLVGSRLTQPVRGAHERQLMGAAGVATDLEEAPPSFAEAWRMCWQIDSLRRIYRTLPFLAPAIVGFGLFAAFLYEEVFGIDEFGRGLISSAAEPCQLIGLVIGAKVGVKLFAEDPGKIFGLLSKVIFAVCGACLVFAFAPHVLIAVAAQMVIAGCLAFVVPGIFAALSLAIPPRARAMGFSMGAVFILPGVLIIPLISILDEAFGIRWGMATMVPLFLAGGLVISSAGDLIATDIAQVWRGAAARSEAMAERQAGRSKLLLLRGLNVSYGDVQVLFDVDLEVDEGEIVALLGTNGAGKSTLLKAVCGLVPAAKGSVIFDGRDITYAPAHEIAPRGVVLVPGGKGVFPSLTVAENLKTASWMDRRDRTLVAQRTAEVLELFPDLKGRLDDPAANLSGGQQQMLALSMAFLSRPRLVMIDELSLGLAPIIVEQLLEIVRRIRDQGTTVIVVEQSVNVALTIAEHAYFMEKGEIRFSGPTAELLDRPDVLRSVFLEGAGAGLAVKSGTPGDSTPSDSTPGLGDDRSRPEDARTRQPASAQPAGEAAPEASLEISDLTVAFGGIRAVSSVDVSVAPGEILGIIGPNGAGKTTLFDLVSGYLTPDHGRIRLAGRDITALAPDARARLGLGRSFQDAGLFPSLTVEQTVAVALDRWLHVRDPLQAALRLPPVQEDEAWVAHRVGELVELFGLGDFRTKFVNELSTGSRRIVDLACLVAHEPSVILLDEPSSGIAQRETEALGPVLLRLRDQLDASILVIEHDMALISSVADRLLALETGQVVTTGTPDEVVRHPDVVASYLGSGSVATERSGTTR